MENFNFTLEGYEKEIFKKLIAISGMCSTSEDRGKKIGKLVAQYNYITNFGENAPTTMDELNLRISRFETLERLLADKDTEGG